MNLLLFQNRQELEEYLLKYNLPTYRATQIVDWIFSKGVFDFSMMSNLPKELISTLEKNDQIFIPKVVKVQHSIDGCKKLLLKLIDGKKIEMVFIPNKKKNTLCISTQVGCKMGCSFCATSKMGFDRDLDSSEIVAQFLLAKSLFGQIGSIVFMGMGEPLDNYYNLISSIFSLKNLANFSPRRITISTCGVAPKIDKLSESGLKVKLALSLVSPISEKRKKLMPIARKYPLQEVKNSLFNYAKKTNRKVTIEYLLLNDFNTSKKDVAKLRCFVGDLSCKVNVIPFNRIVDFDFAKPSKKKALEFTNNLRQTLPVAVTLRDSRGVDIAAACGQLAGDSFIIEDGELKMENENVEC